MTDQLRYNVGKPEMGYLLVHTPSEIGELLGVEPTEFVQVLMCGVQRVAICPNEALRTAVLDLLRVAREWVTAEDLCAVYAAGARKYRRGNFLYGASASQYMDSAARHLVAHLRGDPVDAETGCLHLAHMVWNVLNMARCVAADPLRDDRLYLGAPGLGTSPPPAPASAPAPAPAPAGGGAPQCRGTSDA